MILIGSRAARHWLPDFRAPKDWDLIATLAEIGAWAQDQDANLVSLVPSSEGEKMKAMMTDGQQVEFEIADAGGTAGDIHAMAHPGSMEGLGTTLAVPSLETLWAIKRAHVHRPIHWRKNIADCHVLFAALGTSPSEASRGLMLARRRETDQRKPMKVPSLEKSNSAFFTSYKLAVPILNPHDAYHWAVAYEEAPMFTRMKRDHTLARCERDMFEALSIERRRMCVREETMVIALERYIVPGRIQDQRQAYLNALERVCTNLTSGWFREFAIDQFPWVREPDVDYVALWESRRDWAIAQVSAGGSEAAGQEALPA